MKLCNEVDRDLGFSGVSTFVSTRPEKFIGAIETWDRAERMLVDAVESTGAECGIKPGEGAFYGPKIERHFQDVMGRWWQLGTMQIDTAMPGRFGLKYIGADGAEHEPAMLHRAVLGSLERFIAIYLEHTAGDFPLFLAPQQVAVLPISDRQADYAREIAERLRAAARARRGRPAQRDPELPRALRGDPEDSLRARRGRSRASLAQRQRPSPQEFGAGSDAARAIREKHPGGDQNAWDSVDAVGATWRPKRTRSE